MLTINVEIPALDRLCDLLANRDKAELLEAIEAEIVARLKDASRTGDLERAAKAIAQEETAKGAPEPRKGPQEPAKPEPTNAPNVPEAAEPVKPTQPQTTPEPEKPAITLDALQRAAAQMRDDGRLKEVTNLFGDFGIRKLSDLKGDKLQAFGERLRTLGAKI